MAQVPRGFVGTFVQSPDRTFELKRAHSFLRFAEQEHSGKPDCQGQVGVVENRTGGHGEVVFTVGTVELFVSLNPRDARAMATWAINPIRTPQLNQNLAALIIGIEQPLNV